MPRKLDPAIAQVLKDFGFDKDACWDCHGTWVIYHRVLEQIAAMGDIRFDMPIVLEANSGSKIAAICVMGRLKDKAEWSIGEAAPGNNKNSYPFAMAEKRAKDRVILKLIGLHGLAYSEEEADSFKSDGKSTPVDQPITPAQDALRLMEEIEACKSQAELEIYRNSAPFKGAWKALPVDLQEQVKGVGGQKRASLMDREAA